MNFKKLIIATFAMLAVAGCSHKETRTTSSTKATEDQQMRRNHASSAEAMQTEAFGRSVVLVFDQNNSTLNVEQENRLMELVSSVGADNIQRIEVAAWSDKDFPLKGEDLPKADRALAEARARNIKNYLRDNTSLTTWSISNYNMAETSNWLARTFRTSDYELKSVFAKEASAPMSRSDYNLIASEGGPCKAVVVLIKKQ